MTHYWQDSGPYTISARDVDVDDIRVAPRETFREVNHPEEPILSTTEENKGRRRSIVLTVAIIIILLLALAGLIIGIYSLVLNLKRDDKSASAPSILTIAASTDTTTNASPFACTSTPTTDFQYSTTIPPQCSNYTVNTDETRNMGYTASINFCDNGLPFSNTTPVWLRFRDAAGVVIANSPVPSNRCGTVATGWYAGQYPSIVYSTATSLACFFYGTEICFACNRMSVTNCYTFFVFSLPKPNSCNYRYCVV